MGISQAFEMAGCLPWGHQHPTPNQPGGDSLLCSLQLTINAVIPPPRSEWL